MSSNLTLPIIDTVLASFAEWLGEHTEILAVELREELATNELQMQLFAEPRPSRLAAIVQATKNLYEAAQAAENTLQAIVNYPEKPRMIAVASTRYELFKALEEVRQLGIANVVVDDPGIPYGATSADGEKGVDNV